MICIHIFNKTLMAICSHHIMEINVAEFSLVKKEADLFPEKIDLRNVDLCLSVGTFSISNMKRCLKRQSDYVNGFLFKNKAGECVGYVWVMMKGGNEIQYKVRDCDSFLFDVCVKEKFRRMGVSQKMLSYVMEFLKEKKVKTCDLAVSRNNYAAISAYRKFGFKEKCSKTFVRFCKMNIPHYSV